MNVILLEAVENLGSIGDLVKVKPGYGRNFLLPQGKAMLATPENMKEIEARRAELEKVAAEELAKAKDRAKDFENLEVIIQANAGSEGKLFGSVGPLDIVEALATVQVEAERAEIRMPEGPIGELGEYTIGVHLHSEVNADVLVRVVGEGGETAAVVATEVVDEAVAEEIAGDAGEAAEESDAPEASEEAADEKE
jgi:large subunit ribosomal protein L9